MTTTVCSGVISGLQARYRKNTHLPFPPNLLRRRLRVLYIKFCKNRKVMVYYDATYDNWHHQIPVVEEGDGAVKIWTPCGNKNKEWRYRLITVYHRNAVTPQATIILKNENCGSNSRCRAGAPCRGFGARSPENVRARRFRRSLLARGADEGFGVGLGVPGESAEVDEEDDGRGAGEDLARAHLPVDLQQCRRRDDHRD